MSDYVSEANVHELHRMIRDYLSIFLQKNNQAYRPRKDSKD